MFRYILDRKQAFPNSPLPSSSWVRKTYDSCVADPRDTECKYPQVSHRPQAKCIFNQAWILKGSFGGFEDHRRQSIFFCGHHRDCVPFNSQRANQLAKRVVEECYAVVEDILSSYLCAGLTISKQVLVSGWCIRGDEQDTCSLRGLYAPAFQGGYRSLLELCLGGKQVGVGRWYRVYYIKIIFEFHFPFYQLSTHSFSYNFIHKVLYDAENT